MIELQGNPGSRVSEDEDMRFHNRLSRMLQQNSRPGLKRKSTLISSKKNKAFEDSRITRLYFERYRILELSRMMMIVATMVLNILEYEVSFAYQLTNTYDNEIALLLYIIMIMTIVIILMTIAAYTAEFQFKQKSLTIPYDSNLFNTNLIYSLIIEVIILLPTSNPFTQDYKIYFIHRYSNDVRFYFVNEILTFIMLLRALLVVNIAFKFQYFYSNRVNRLCRIYSVEFGPHFMFKVAIKQYPYLTISFLFLIGMFIFSYQLEISERALLRTDTEIDLYNINTSIWICLITIATVGYGDFYPVTDLGRFSMTSACFYGVTVTSLFTAVLYADLQPFIQENQSFALLDRTNISKDIKTQSSYAVYYIFKISKYLTGIMNERLKTGTLSNQDLNESQTIASSLKQATSNRSSLIRNYRDVDGEDYIQMAERKFNELSNIIKELRDLLQKMKIQSLMNNNNNKTPFSSNQKQQNTITAASCEARSKDDKFFEQLNDSKSDNALMQFDED